MILYVNGQDIARLVLGIIREGGSDMVTIPASPENFLSTIDYFLKKNNLNKEHIEKIILISGPGSATALRTSHAIANALAFGWGKPVVSFKKDPTQTDESCIADMIKAPTTVLARPFYGQDPHITLKKSK